MALVLFTASRMRIVALWPDGGLDQQARGALIRHVRTHDRRVAIIRMKSLHHRGRKRRLRRPALRTRLWLAGLPAAAHGRRSSSDRDAERGLSVCGVLRDTAA